MHHEPKGDVENNYPEGGFQANLVVGGSFSSIMGGLGLMNSIGIYQAWISTHQLSSLSAGQIGWIFGIYNFMVFFCGIQIGPIFDARGPRLLMWIGSALIIITFICMGFCTLYWHFLVVIGILGGMGTSFIFIVPVASIGHFFNRRRGAATGLALSGGSIGGVIFPLVLENLAPKIGFAWSTRIIGLITLVLLIPGVLLVKANFPPKPPSPPSAKVFLPDLSILKNPVLALTTMGVFFIEWGFFIPLEYIASYSLANGIDRRLSYLMVVFLNAGSFPGRWLPGILADKIGRFNTLLLTNILCLVSVLAVWMPAGGNIPAVIIFSVVFGFASGSNISLVPVCVGELCPVENYGRYYTTVYTIVSFGALTGVPIAGEILHRCNGEYWVSANLVPLTVIKGAGSEYIPLPQGENATTADFHSIRTNTTDSPSYFTSGFYKIEAGPARPAHYTFEETKYVLNGQIDVLDEATGITHHLVPGDFAFFHVGSKVKFSTKSNGFAFYAVTRPVRAPHPNLQGREEKKSRL